MLGRKDAHGNCNIIFPRLDELRFIAKFGIMHVYNSLADALTGLKSRGYTEDFSLQPSCIACASLDLQLHPEHFSIDEYYRFEGDSNPDDNSIIYAISSNDGIKGTLIDAYGAYSENLTHEMADKIRLRH